MKRPLSILDRICLVILLVISLAGIFPIQTASAASTYTVTTLSDPGDGTCDSSCALRDAILAANASYGVDTINFSATLNGTIELASSLPNISESLVIDGAGQSITIRGNNFRILVVSSGATVTLNALTFQNGLSTSLGGAIYNNGSLTVTNSTFDSNRALVGGAIYNNNVLAVSNSTFIANQANLGGGISNFNQATISNSTLTGNIGTVNGGGVYNEFGSLSLFNDTFSANSAVSGGGVYNASGANLNYANTILANSATGGDCVSGGAIGTNTKNLVEDHSCSATLSGDPKLDVLADNGGPTMTMKLLPGSPAIDVGDNTVCAAAPVNNLDQRGVVRPIKSTCDLGAYEAEIYAPAPAVGLSATLLKFAPQWVDTTSASQTVTVTNIGSAALTIGTLTISGDFILHTNSCSGASLLPNETCKFSVAFSPITSGWRSGLIGIPSNASTSPNRISLRGSTKAGTQLLTMGNFDLVTQPIPWVVDSPSENLVRLRDCTKFLSPLCSAMFLGDKQNPIISAVQIVNRNGLAGDKFYISLSSRAYQVPAGGQYQLLVSFYNGGGLVETKSLLFSNGTHGFQSMSMTYTAPKAYTRILFNFTYQKIGGRAWFDDALLILLP
jgi:CSLREA domain-containing protein